MTDIYRRKYAVNEFGLRFAIRIGCCLFISFFVVKGMAEVDGSAIADKFQNGNWLSYGHSYNEQRFSPVKEIDQDNVSRLGLAWYLDLPEMRSLVSTPLVINGVLYFSGSYSIVTAVEASSGKVLWRHDPKTLKHAGMNRKVLWDFNRGIAYWKEKIFVGTGDGRLLALDAATGEEIWSTLTLDRNTSRTITGAPRVFNDLVIIGHGGADWGPVRGYVTAYDVDTGEQRWRFYTVPGNPANGFENDAMRRAARTWSGEWWRYGGGGTVWNAMTYDPEFNRVYLGTGNGSPWNQKIRSPGGGDNLFLCSIVALDADTGEYVWHYQTTPGEIWDFNSAMDIVLAELKIKGIQRKVLMHAPKNGFFYVIDRLTGKLISAEKFGKVTWASHVDMETGRPIEIKDARYTDGEALIWPSPFGAHNWHPMSYNPQTGLVYIPYQEVPGFYSDKGIKLKDWRNTPFSAATTAVHSFGHDIPTEGTWSALLAWDPIKQKQVWQVSTPGVWSPGTLTTAGSLVFQGRADGYFMAYAANSGKTVWRFNTGLGISAPPVSYEVRGKQYIALLVGWGGTATSLGGSVGAQHGWNYGVHTRRLVVFALDGEKELPPLQIAAQASLVKIPRTQVDAKNVAQGRDIYAAHCGICHGSGAVAGGYAPDLRTSSIALQSRTLQHTVKNGRIELGMPAFENLSDKAISDLNAFIVHQAIMLEKARKQSSSQ